jgi:murein hydrolase activator
LRYPNDIPALNKARACCQAALLLAYLLLALPLAGQNRKELESRRQQLMLEIRQTESQLKETKKNKAATLDQYLALQNQIRKRQQLVSTLRREIDYANAGMQRSREVLAALSVDVERLKTEYAQIIRTAYRHKISNSFLIFIFSADSFNNAFRRWQYIRQYDRYRRKQARLIMETQEALTRKNLQLEQRKKEKEQLLASQEEQQQLLSQELGDKNLILKALNTSESKLAKDLDAQQKAHETLNDAIEAVIREEITRAKREARSADAPAGAAPAESLPLSNDFQKNRGRLPWPVNSGYITRQFGKQPHPTVPSIQISNNGIDIRTEDGAQVFAVFEGRVAGVQFIPGYKNTIIIQHGNYYTVYSNLEEVYVERDDQVERQKLLGKLGADKPEVHFEIWLEKKRLNPIDWVARR